MKTEKPYIGIDYGKHGNANRNWKTGIHYGAISLHSLHPEMSNDAVPIYPEEIEIDCKHCNERYTSNNSEIPCPDCGEINYRAWDHVEPETWNYTPNDPDYKTEYSESLNCLIITKSPYYTFAVFCSPCLPGCGDLNNPCTEGIKTYCLGPDFFEDDKCPYKYFKIEE